MYIRYSKSFIQKLTIPEYPLKGFYATLKSDSNESFNDDRLIKMPTSSKISMNTMIKDGAFRISFNLTGLDMSNYSNMLCLYAIDQFIYSDASQWGGGKLFSQLAAIIYLVDDGNPDEESVENLMRNEIINIFDFKPEVNGVLYPIKCSFDCVTMKKNPGMAHYAEPLLGQSNFYDDDKGTDDLIDRDSGIKELKDQITVSDNIDLQGVMTIKSNGLIQL